ncbi:pseudaminic acid CMP-transferase [Aliivibrio fischeri MJ11]|uniref:Pseudaminic acid CMP-transferase n=1 Tax=Aliivibrio fischeri (strain MJ11) TaxID=388396 RepID=B5FFV7_ALIFM|nr:pseudaminic acid cytidylyltransferase [Aliivibrio fischeri]ACH64900.1 pseudaminic acid CMP-transferase [Aliivibrio fischeri MJ11]
MKIAIIPARGGSKRIPRKNIKLFYGKPMIAYSIEAAIESGCFDKVIVSTDDHEIAEVAKQYGAEVPFMRPKNISDDYATTMDVIQHAVQWYEQQGLSLTYVCCLYATAPFVQSKDLQKGWEIVQQPDVKYAFSATTFPFPIQRAIKLLDSGSVSMFSPEYELTRSQDLEESYHDAGQFYWGEASAFSQKLAIFSQYSRCVILPRKQVQDIDTAEDWEFAEALFALKTREV